MCFDPRELFESCDEAAPSPATSDPKFKFFLLYQYYEPSIIQILLPNLRQSCSNAEVEAFGYTTATFLFGQCGGWGTKQACTETQ